MSERDMRAINLGFRFVLELLALAALLVWGFSVSDELVVQLLLGLGVPALVMVIWGTLVSPKAPRRLDDPIRAALEIVIFAAASLALVAAGSPVAGVLLAVSAAISLALMFLWDQRGY